MASKVDNAAAALEELMIDSVEFRGGELVDTYVTPTIIRDEDGEVLISGEDGKGLVNYYGEPEYGIEDMYIHPRIEEVAKHHGCMLEWQDPGTVGIYPD